MTYVILGLLVLVALARLISKGADVNAHNQLKKSFVNLDMVVDGAAYKGQASELVDMRIERLGGYRGFDPDNPFLMATGHKCALLARQGSQWYAYHVLLWNGRVKQQSIEPLSLAEAKWRVGRLGEMQYRKYFGPHDSTARVVPLQ